MDLEFIPEEVQRAGLDAYVRIGEDVTQQLERRAGGLVRARTVKGKYVLKDKSKGEPVKVLVGPSPELPIPGGMAGPGLLTETLVRRGRTTSRSIAWSPSTRGKAGRFPVHHV